MLAKQTAVLVDDGGVVGVLVRVDSTDDRDIFNQGCHAGNARSFRTGMNERMRGEPAGRATGL